MGWSINETPFVNGTTGNIVRREVVRLVRDRDIYGKASIDFETDAPPDPGDAAERLLFRPAAGLVRKAAGQQAWVASLSRQLADAEKAQRLAAAAYKAAEAKLETLAESAPAGVAEKVQKAESDKARAAGDLQTARRNVATLRGLIGKAEGAAASARPALAEEARQQLVVKLQQRRDKLLDVLASTAAPILDELFATEAAYTRALVPGGIAAEVEAALQQTHATPATTTADQADDAEAADPAPVPAQPTPSAVA